MTITNMIIYTFFSFKIFAYLIIIKSALKEYFTFLMFSKKTIVKG